ncbi:hypothetical protein E2C01_004688 [Portunus trituberculatus]|uniref:Uncharacterized protein n=1 Tax=Portunus trituberculatus TaxID=210409 RepID=A0A5B7CSZ8_PORTR|nr:hypothetical protein [Portunus trituberculatus]
MSDQRGVAWRDKGDCSKVIAGTRGEVKGQGQSWAVSRASFHCAVPCWHPERVTGNILVASGDFIEEHHGDRRHRGTADQDAATPTPQTTSDTDGKNDICLT